MPELPEVELVARSLQKLVGGRTFASVELRRERLAPEHTPADFAALLGGASIVRVDRRGKHILIELDNRRTLIVHLRMSGRFMLLGADREDPKFAHAVFYLDDEMRLVFEDQRHFGFMRIVETDLLQEAKELKKLAPEPFSDAFNAAYLRSVFKDSKRAVKLVLLDQTRVLGLGNIYASEAMFLAKINPKRRASSFTRPKTEKLFGMIREVLAESMAHGSTLNVDPENIDGSYYGGGYESAWRVYDRENEPCVECETPIRRIVQGGRSTYYCPACQR
ncbi:MAG: bifunctional DNA-formamidopyrimidine glycosylase/DNA-(apurinic or apyrimidinic site) lyase [Acidobacteria bacterium]|nr:bifunctional DNA-formamidopyrimidine glycosylase/DNA-(apurinic or apyrimidinic site) lyase [Acidobacteriota bacterium]MBK8150727.1 bifunctional DNA-formamidopyrimidine glycosylase/DNA-(apurinic or apyrimidinic site) lyase [Acidobacteriota bacterium]